MHIFIDFALAITFLYNTLHRVMRKVTPLPYNLKEQKITI